MSETLRTPIAPIGWSIALHAALAALLFFGLTLREPEPEVVLLPIDAVVVDDAILQAAGQQRRDEERRETRRQEEAAAAAETRRLEAERARQEQDRLQQEQAAKRAAEDARLAAERKARTEAETKRKAEQEAQAKAAADKRRETQEKRERDVVESDLRAGKALAPVADEARTWFGFHYANNIFAARDPALTADEIVSRIDRPIDPDRWQAGIARIAA